MKKLIYSGLVALILSLAGTTGASENPRGKHSIPHEKYQLNNGLDVILHQDKSDPIVAVAIHCHVGSNRRFLIPGFGVSESGL